jgi:3-methylcrotonyl-CoA carboxylase alpha subunit
VTPITLRTDDRPVTAEVEGERVGIEGVTFTVESFGDGFYRVTGDKGQQSVGVAGPPDRPWVFVDGLVVQVEIEAASRTRPRGRTGSHDLSSPMPATVMRVVVEAGATVSKGETLLVLEAMKMEVPVRAPADGVVTAIHCKPGDLVQPGVALLDFA